MDVSLTKWYNSLSASVKAALVETTITQKNYQMVYNDAPSSYNYSGYSLSNGKTMYFTLVSSYASITRYFFPIPLSYFFEFYNKKDLTAEELGAVITCKKKNSNYYAWALDSLSNGGICCFGSLNPTYGRLTYTYYGDERTDRGDYCPCFRIDLSKISWSAYAE